MLGLDTLIFFKKKEHQKKKP